jgi:hypothetical protein
MFLLVKGGRMSNNQAKVDNNLNAEELDAWLRREPEQEQEGNP